MLSASLVPRSVSSFANIALINDSLSYLLNAREVPSNLSDDIRDSKKSTIFVPEFGPFDRVIPEMPLSGYPGHMFYVIHISAVISLSLSSLVGIILIAYLFLFGNHGKGSSELNAILSVPSFPKPSPHFCTIL